MYEFHGWATISLPEDLDECYEEVSEKIKKWVNKLNKIDNCVFDLRVNNGEYHVWTAGCKNRRIVIEEELLNFYRFIGQIAPCSYGLLYVLDHGVDQEFKVYVLVRGQLLERRDPFLSPFFPVIEDPSE